MLVPLLCDRKTKTFKKCLASEHYPLLTPPADGAQGPTFWATLVNSESFVIVILVSLLCNSKTESCKSCLTAAYHPLLQMAPPATTYCTWPGSGFARMYSYFYVNGVHIQYDWQHSKIYCIEYRMSSSLFLYFLGSHETQEGNRQEINTEGMTSNTTTHKACVCWGS